MNTKTEISERFELPDDAQIRKYYRTNFYSVVLCVFIVAFIILYLLGWAFNYWMEK